MYGHEGTSGLSQVKTSLECIGSSRMNGEGLPLKYGIVLLKSNAISTARDIPRIYMAYVPAAAYGPRTAPPIRI